MNQEKGNTLNSEHLAELVRAMVTIIVLFNYDESFSPRVNVIEYGCTMYIVHCTLCIEHCVLYSVV